MKNIIITLLLASAPLLASAQDATILAYEHPLQENSFGVSVTTLGGHNGASIGYLHLNGENYLAPSVLFNLNKNRANYKLNDWVSIRGGINLNQTNQYLVGIGYLRRVGRLSASINYLKDVGTSSINSEESLTQSNPPITFTIGFNILGNPPQKAGCWTLY